MSVGKKDRMRLKGKSYTFVHAPAHPEKLYLEVSGGHKEMPPVEVQQIITWLQKGFEKPSLTPINRPGDIRKKTEEPPFYYAQYVLCALQSCGRWRRGRQRLLRT